MCYQRNYCNQIMARVVLVALPTGMVTSPLVTVTVPLLAETPVTTAPVPDSTTFVDVRVSCFAESSALYAPSTYDAAAATVVLSTSPSANAGETRDKTAKIQKNFFIFLLKWSGNSVGIILSNIDKAVKTKS